MEEVKEAEVKEATEIPMYFKEVLTSMIHNREKPLSVGEISYKAKELSAGINSGVVRDSIEWIIKNAPEYFEIVIPDNNKLAEKYRIKVSGSPDTIIGDLKLKVGIPLKDTPVEKSKIRALKILKHMEKTGEPMTAVQMAKLVGENPDVGYALKNKMITEGGQYFIVLKLKPAHKYQWNPENEISPEHALSILYSPKERKVDEDEEERKPFANEDILSIITNKPLTIKEICNKTKRNKGSVVSKLYRLKQQGINIEVKPNEYGIKTYEYKSATNEEDTSDKLREIGERRKIDRSLSKPEQIARDLILRVKDIKCINAYRKPWKSVYTFDKDYRGVEIQEWTESRKKWLDSEIAEVFGSDFQSIEMPVHGIATIEYEKAMINVVFSEKGNHVISIMWNR